MHQVYIAMALAGVLVVALGLCSKAIKRTPLAEPMLCTAVGVIVGPHLLGWLDPAKWHKPEAVLMETARVALAISLMGVALRTSPSDLRTLARPVLVLLTLGMLLMTALGGAAAWLALGVSPLVALMIGAAVAPTDPVVSSSIVTGEFASKHLPVRVRAALSLESGANDGLAYPIVVIPILVLTHVAEAGSTWLLDRLLMDVVLASLMGAALGYGVGKLLGAAERRGWIEGYSILILTLSLSLMILGLGRLLMMDGLIAVFVAGLAFNLASGTGDRQKEERVQEGANQLSTFPVFLLFGAILPWEEWARHGAWAFALFGLLVLALRRPPMFLLLSPLLKRPLDGRDLAFLGWFGPVGVAAIFYATHAAEKTGDPLVWPATAAAVLASILAHGMSAAPLTKLYYAHGGRKPREPEFAAQKAARQG